MKKTVQTLAIAVFTILCSNRINAQQDPYVTHYMFNRNLYNPAAIGANGKFCISALSHYQYTGFEDRTPEFHPQDPKTPGSPNLPAVKSVGPKTQMFSFGAPLNFKDPSGETKNYGGVGIGFINDKLGYEFSTHVKIGLAGRLPLANGSSIAIGGEYTLLQKGLDGGQLKPLAPNDPTIPSNTEKKMLPNFAAGIYYNNPMTNSTSWKDMWIGLSGTELTKKSYSYTNATLNRDITYSNTVTHLYLMGGITKQEFLGKADLQFHPSFMFKRAAVNQIEVTGLLEYQQRLWGGLAYRSTSDALSVLLGYSGFQGPLQGLRIGYSYDLTLTRILSVSSGTHEIQLNYCFTVSIPDPPIKRYVDPRHQIKDSTLD